MSSSRFLSRFLLLPPLALAACSAGNDAPGHDATEPRSSVEANEVPAAMQAALQPRSAGVLAIDASDGHYLLSLSGERRRFADREALRAYVRTTFGAVDGKGGALELRTEQHGEVHWWDEATRSLYRVVDPVAAMLGGVNGEVIVGNETLCLDSDGVCDGLASYLQPVATPSAPSTVHTSSASYRVENHSFYHNVFGYYMRAGGNSRIIAGDPMGSLDIRECTGATVTAGTRIDALTIDVRTGGDDLRGGSDNATAVLTLTDGTVWRQPLNGTANWANDSLHSVPWRLPRTVTASEIRRFGIETSFGGGIGGDNWNIDQVAVRFAGTSPSSGTLLVHAGAPFVRLTGSYRAWSTEVRAAVPTASTPVSRVFVTVRTGGDDLRGGSDNAFAKLIVDGRATTPITINGGARWENGSTHSTTLIAPAGTTFGTLRGLELSTNFGGGIGGDNWNVDEVLVEADMGGGIRRTIMQRNGAPLVRFTGQDRAWTATFPAPGGPQLCATRRPAQTLTVGLTLLATRENFPLGGRSVLPMDMGQVRRTGEPFVEHAVFSLFAGNTAPPEGAINTAVGVCSSHDGPGGVARTGAGDQRGFCD